MAGRESIIAFLLSIPPEKLSEYCSASQKIAEICAADDFIQKYSQIHKAQIRTRSSLRLLAYPSLPQEKAPPGYVVRKNWHWAFETWAQNSQYKGMQKGEIPHFNIMQKGGNQIFHVYLEYNTGNFLVIDELGQILFSYN